MSKELLEAIAKLDIRVYTTISGRQLIGNVSFDEDSKITLNSPLEFIKSIDEKTNKSILSLVQPVVHNMSCIKINSNSIESETIADMRLKKVYCDQLIYNQLQLMIEGLELIKEESIEDQDESNDYFKSVIDKWNS